MKQGSGEDPFADLEEETDEQEGADEEPAAESVEDESTATSEVDGSSVEPSGSDAETGRGADSSDAADASTKERYTDSRGGARGEDAPESGASGVETSETGGSDGSAEQTKAEVDGIPWVLRRSRVKEDRGNVHQFFLREEYSAREDEIIEAVAGELDMRQKDLQKLDVREAMVAAADPEDIAAVLRDWGYEYLK